MKIWNIENDKKILEIHQTDIDLLNYGYLFGN
jgi:hypothetical protein